MDVEGLSGPDRAMLCILATWTGLRRHELGSITRESVHLENATGSITVIAGYTQLEMQDKEEAIHSLPTPATPASEPNIIVVAAEVLESLVTAMVTGKSIFCSHGLTLGGSVID